MVAVNDNSVIALSCFVKRNDLKLNASTFTIHLGLW